MPKRKKNIVVLLESLIILAVILLLGVAFVISSINRSQERDMERISEINNMRAALQFHYLDKGYYPIETEWCSLELNCDNLSKEMKSYLSELPTDPLFSSKGEEYSYQYRTTEDGLEYRVYTSLEKGGLYGLGSRGSFVIPPPEQ